MTKQLTAQPASFANAEAATSVRVAACQMVSGADLQHNLDAATRLIAQAAEAGAQLVCLPEYFCLFGHHDQDKVAIREDLGTGTIQSWMAQQAQTHGVWLIGGSMPLACDDPHKVYNSCLVFDPQGQRRARYDKIHLFGFQKGNERYDESQSIQAGSTPVVVDCGLSDGTSLRVALSICYDLRFPELYRGLGPVDLIVVPAAFTYTTGQAHWELLLRTRAVENQCYVLACAQGGQHENGRRTWGQSLLIDPWGRIVAELAQGEGVVHGLIQAAVIQEIRLNLPALRHRVL